MCRMLFRDQNGKLKEVRRDKFLSDREYYNKLLSFQTDVSKVYHEKNRILDIVERKMR